MSNVKNILIAAEIFPPAIGGPATYTVELANALNQRGFKVRILCYGKPNKKVLAKGIKINWVSNRWPTFIKYALYFKKLLCFSYGYQTIYAMGPVASGLAAMLVKKIIGKKLIVKVVGDYAWEQAFNFGQTKHLLDKFLDQEKQKGKIGKLQKIEFAVCKTANLVIVPSEYLKKVVIKWGIEEEKIKVIYNAFSSCHSRFDQKFSQKIEKKKGLIISIGRLVKWKGFETLIRIMPDILNMTQNYNLEIFGAGPEKEKLSQLIKELGLVEKVKIQNIAHDELMEKLINAEIFVLNSGYEGLSHTILEAFAAGVPVIATNVGGNPELIQDGENGILIEYNNSEQLKDAVLKLYNDPELGKKFVENSKKVLAKFNKETMVNKVIELLHSLVSIKE